MQVTDHIHAIKIPFAVSTRFVYAYLIYGKKICMVDSGISSAKEKILGYLKQTGRAPEEINLIVQTHSHADHIGLSAEIKKISGCKVAAHGTEQVWIEDIEEQYRRRPTPTFRSYVQDSTKVDWLAKDGDLLDLGNGENLKVIHTPGHSPGSISLVYPADGALFSGDTVPLAGGLPIYSDIFVMIQSIRKLQAVKGLQALFSSWHDPIQGGKVYRTMDEALTYMQKVHDAVRKENAATPSLDSRELTIRVLRSLGIPESLLSSIVVTTIEAHRQAGQYPNILTV